MVFKTDCFCHVEMHLGEIPGHYHIQELISVGANESKYFGLMLWQPWFSYYSLGNDYSEHLQCPIQQSENENFQLIMAQISYSITTYSVCMVGLFVWEHSLEICHRKEILTAYNKVLHISCDFRGHLFPSTGYGAATAHQEASLSVPWDPGGAEWLQLEGKPPSKEGRMLATLLPSRWAAVMGQGLLRSETRELTINTNTATTRGYGCELDGFGLLCFCLLLPLWFPTSLQYSMDELLISQ